jgi:predicted RNA-binding Zn ribbon-like protein
VPTPTKRTPLDDAGRVPRALTAIEAFLNTVDGSAGDALGTPAEMSSWLTRQRLVPPQTEFDERDRRRLVEVRTALAALAASNSGGAVDRRAVTTLNEAARRIRLSVRLHPDEGYRLMAEAPGIDRPIGELLVRVMGAMAGGEWQRLKLCANPDCRRAYYDSSRNHSARWCSMATCGNRIKGRAYRRRRSAVAGATERLPDPDVAVAS